MPTTQDAYLHVVTGGYDEKKRKEVRKLFQEQESGDPPDKQLDMSNYDLLVGALEEIHAVGVKTFTLPKLYKVMEIFGVLRAFCGCEHYDEFAKVVFSALPILGIVKHNDSFQLPEARVLEALVAKYCTEEKREARIHFLSRIAELHAKPRRVFGI
jgi:hypothetical protein